MNMMNRDFVIEGQNRHKGLLFTGGNKIIFSSGARFQLIDFLNVTDLNWVFLNPVK